MCQARFAAVDFTVRMSGCRLVSQAVSLCLQGGGLVDTSMGVMRVRRRGEWVAKREFNVPLRTAE
jgi:hypothetical protein